VILGVIADDFTGATDVAGMLVGAGMRTVQVIGVPAWVSITPRAFGPSRRRPPARATDTISSCSARPSSPRSAKPSL
jgi:uncharacterized protein YgbK (DUF1537 family)